MRRIFGVVLLCLANCFAEPQEPLPTQPRPESRHWAYKSLVSPPIPSVRDEAWVKNPIDAFVLSALEAKNETPRPLASASVLARRVSLDLVGLPAKPGDETQNYEELVDRLLASPHYGEHLAREWLDAARFADTHGYHEDSDRQAWPWRDWVIAAFNSNLPFDQFTIEQLAGDLLPEATEDQILASSFNRNHPITAEGGTLDEEFRVVYGVDRVSTVGTIWMGLTLGCARCHDHKYDPITQRDFYSMFDCFNDTPENGNGGANDFAPRRELLGPIAGPRRSVLERELIALELEFTTAGVQEEKQKWRSTLAGSPAVVWHNGTLSSTRAENGTTLTLLGDRSILASGENPGTETYELVFDTELTNIRALKIEALTHDSLPGRGPGRASNGNLSLTELETFAEDDAGSRRIEWSHAWADHAQTGHYAAGAIDGRGATSWAIGGRQKNVYTAIFTTAEGFGPRVRVRLRQELGTSHTFGRFRVSFSSDLLAGMGSSIEEQDRFYLQYFAADDIRDKARRWSALKNERESIPVLPRVLIMEDSAQRDTFVLERGQYDRPTGERVVCGAPKFLGQFPEEFPKNRWGLAQWLVSPGNVLTPRVIVNRYWRLIFGRGLTESVDDFGARGEVPANLELLDWLASELVRSGWDIKGLLRLMVTSATYQQSSEGPWVKLTAEQIRDQALFVSGLLVEEVGGPSVFPRQAPGLWEELNDRAYAQVHRADVRERAHRRSVYSYWKRTVPHPMMTVFDAPSRDVSVVKRERTDTPLQALALLHEPQMIEAARALAERMFAAAGGDRDRAIAQGYALLFLRAPSPAELAATSALYEAELAVFGADVDAALSLLRIGDAPRSSPHGNAAHAAMTQVARALLNTAESVTKE